MNQLTPVPFLEFCPFITTYKPLDTTTISKYSDTSKYPDKIYMPSQNYLNKIKMSKLEFQSILNYVSQLENSSKSCIIKKSQSGLPVSLACLHSSEKLSTYILYKNRFFPIAEGGYSKLTLGLNIDKEKEIAFRSVATKHVGSYEKSINMTLSSHQDLFVAAGIVLEYEGSVSKRYPHELNDDLRYMKKNIPKPVDADHFKKAKEIVPKTGFILELMKCSAHAFFQDPTKFQVLNSKDLTKIKIAVIRDILNALNVMHNQFKIVHHDLKLDNVLLTNEFRAKLGDFGLAAPIGTEGMRKGTQYFRAPEVKEKSISHPSADMWNFGAILINLFTSNNIILGWRKLCDYLETANDSQVTKSMVLEIFKEKVLDEMIVYRINGFLSFYPLINKCLQYDHTKRITVEEALKEFNEIANVFNLKVKCDPF